MRDKATLVARAMSSVSSALIFGAIYWRLGTSQAAVQSRVGLLQAWARAMLYFIGSCLCF